MGCWCGNGDIPQEKVVPKTDCDSACPGDNSKMCGGFDRMNVYTAVESDTNTCILRSMGYLHTYGGMKHGKVKRDIAKLNPAVVDKYSGGILTDDDPSGYKQCIDNSYIRQQIPDLLKSCQDKYPGDRRYKKQIKRYINRYAAMTCLQKLSTACSEVWRDQIITLAYPSATGYGSEPITGAGYGYEPITGSGYGYEPITGYGYGYEPITGSGSGYEPITGSGYGSEPITGYGYGYEPITGAGYGYEPTTGNGYAYAPITGDGYGYESITGDGYGYEPITGDGYGYEPITGDGYGYM